MLLYWAFYYRFKLPLIYRYARLTINIVALLLAFVPLGLPLVATLGLSIIARRLRIEHHVLSKRTGATITLGAATVLVVDKTGTLTQNVVTVTRLISSVDLKPIVEAKMADEVMSAVCIT